MNKQGEREAKSNQTLCEWYLHETWGGHSDGYRAQRNFRERLAMGQRIGQAFFNSLPHEDAEKLRETSKDPFYFGMGKTREAIDFLCSKEA